MISILKKNYLFLLSFIALFFLYGYYDILFLRPQSMHQWRQADCLQLAHNYLNNWNFFQPSIHNYFSDNDTSGKSAGEFPILYYFVAILWKIFGEHEFIYRIVVLTIFYAGLYVLNDLLKNLFNSVFWSLSITILISTSPILVFYSNNFLTNVPAFSFMLLGWNYFYKYYIHKKNKWLIVSTVFFTLAGLLKMTAYISFIIIGFYYFVEFIGYLLKPKEPRRIFKELLNSFITLFSGFLILLSWYVYATYYNNLHGGKYTFNGLMPVWEMSKEKWASIKTFVDNILVHQFLSTISLWVVVFMMLFLLLNFKKVNKFIYTTLILLIIAITCFVLLWIQAMDAHDYYIINLLILPLFIFVGFIWHFKINYEYVLKNKTIKILFSVFVAYNIFYATNNFKMRYWQQFNYNSGIKKMFCAKPEIDYWWWIGNHNLFESLNDIEPYNRSLGIKKTDLVAFVPDESFAISLYLMNQKGWTSGFGIENNNNPAKRLSYLINKKNLKYLFLRDSTALNKEYLKPFLQKQIGQYKGVLIYALK